MTQYSSVKAKNKTGAGGVEKRRPGGACHRLIQHYQDFVGLLYEKAYAYAIAQPNLLFT
ncbi:hypothetical protein H6G36_03605 [Anabaena minutissima FACHB-250]|nr:hypothetical protein [Anabaena minutissima FACHB-250]